MLIKKVIYIVILCIYVCPTQADAVFTVGQGGTGKTTFPQGSFIFGNGTNPIGSTYSPSFSFINATTTTATSTFSGNVFVNGNLKLGIGSSTEVFFNDKGVFSTNNQFVFDKDDNYTLGAASLSVPYYRGDYPGVPFLTLSDGISLGYAASLGSIGDGGEVSISASSGGEVYGRGGQINISAGEGHGGENSDDQGGNGGNVNIRAGNSNGNTYQAGNILINAGNSSGSSYPGRIDINAGVSSSSGYPGSIDLYGVIHMHSKGHGVHLNLDNITNGTNLIFPNYSGTLGLLEANQIWSGNNVFNKGASATTTVNFGQLGETTSKSCFNTKNTDGNDISFYFIGTSMVVENNMCQ